MHFVCSSLNKAVLDHMLIKDPNLNHITTKEVVKAWGVAIRVHFDATNAPITMRQEEAVGPAGAQSFNLHTHTHIHKHAHAQTQTHTHKPTCHCVCLTDSIIHSVSLYHVVSLSLSLSLFLSLSLSFSHNAHTHTRTNTQWHSGIQRESEEER